MLKAANHAAHFLMEAVLGLTGAAAIAGCIFAWCLAQGPMDITALAQREQAALTGDGARLSIGHAALAWEGFHDPTSPIDIRVTDISVAATDGTSLLRLPTGRVALSVPQLLLGRVVPRAVEIDDATVTLRRTADGRLMLDVNDQREKHGTAGQGGNEIMSELARPARGAADRQADLPFLTQLQRVLIRRAHVTLHDAALGVVWEAQSALIDLKRQRDGGVHGAARLDLAIGPVHATLSARAELSADGTHIIAATTDVTPAALAALSPAFAQFALLDAPLRTTIDATVAPDLSPRTLHLSVTLGAGRIHVGTGAVPLQSASAELDATPTQATLHGVRVSFAALPGSNVAPPTLSASAAFTRSPGRVSGRFTADIGATDFTDLPAYWPTGTGGGARPWIVGNVTAGSITSSHVAGTIEAPADFSDVTLKSLTGALTAKDMTLWWLRPIPPLQHADAKLIIESPDVLRITVSGGQQKGLRLTSGSMRISGLMAKDQVSQIDVGLQGGLPDALSLLAHPRLNLLSRLPFPVTNPAGEVNAKLAIRLPLDNRVTMDQIGIASETALANVHLGEIAAGRDLDDGQLTLNVGATGLTLAGTAALAGIPATLDMTMDFRAGPQDQIMQHVSVQGVARPADLERAGLPAHLVTAGTAAVGLDYTVYRNATAALTMNADLTKAELATPFAWSKPAGQPASAEAQLSLDHGRVARIDRLHAQGPGLAIASSLSKDSSNREVLHLDRVQIGRTDLHGTIALPGGTADAWRVELAGPLLDLSGYLQSRSGAKSEDTGDDDAKGPPWSADLAFSRVSLAKDESAANVVINAASDGAHIAHARLNADAGRITASIEPTRTGRHLAIDAADAGAVLLAANVFDNIRGGHLLVAADYADTEPHAPLSGTATLEKFRLLDAPAVGRLLKAMTFYGAVDLLRGPGLGFAKAVAPFRWQQRLLRLDNARVFSASLGVTVQGGIDLRHRTADLSGTIVPAYFFNHLLGAIPVVGKLFSPEKGSGVFAARYSITGKLADPTIGVNPLSALTPGILRSLFALL